MAEVLFTTCREWPNFSPSDLILAEALRQLGHSVRPVPWNDPPVDQFQKADLVLLRANWDYYDHVAEFRMWLDDVASSTRVLNSAPLVHWNLHKGYMLELQTRGLKVPRSILLEPNVHAEDIYERHGWSQAVIKPAYGASGTSVELRPRTKLAEWARTVWAKRPNDSWIVQEFVPEIRTEGELSIVFLNGAYSHAICKTPPAGEFRTNSKYEPVVTRVDSLGQQVIHQAAECLRLLSETPLYARVDGVLAPSGFHLLELELNEPTLYFTHASEKAVEFASAIHARVVGDR